MSKTKKRKTQHKKKIVPLTFRRLRHQNVRRCEEKFHPLKSWSVLEWAGALCGESGEFANMAKKMRRGEKVDKKAMGKELADIIMYCDLAAAALDLSLEEFVVLKFNEVSMRPPASKRRL